jgi:multidrug resistance efflux pump
LKPRGPQALEFDGRAAQAEEAGHRVGADPAHPAREQALGQHRAAAGHRAPHCAAQATRVAPAQVPAGDDHVRAPLDGRVEQDSGDLRRVLQVAVHTIT